MTGIHIALSTDAVEAIAERAAEIVLERLDADRGASPWLSGAQATADYLGWPRERVYKHLGELPHVRHGNRLMFRRDELDRFLAEHPGAGVSFGQISGTGNRASE